MEPDTIPGADQIARNEVHFRSMNERIAGTVDGAVRSSPTGFVCECGHADCQRLVDLGREEYLAVRAHPRRFLVAPGHEMTFVEQVVDRVDDRYLVVEKPPEVIEVIDDATRREDDGTA